MPDSLFSTRVLDHDDRRNALEFDRCLLVVTKGPQPGHSHPIETSVVRIGSSPNCDLVIADSAVSREHCEIRVDDRGYRLHDLDSTNGTFVQGVRIGEAWLVPGTVITVGETDITFQGAPERVSIPLSQEDHFGHLHGRSVRMRELFHLLERIADTDSTVLVIGETGTGKELVARSLHEASARKGGPFVTVDCGSLPENLIESELFGHVKGAFTGATSDRPGAFEEASGGTIFLDEIGELPPPQQAKLLRVLEAREVKRVGANESVPVDVRIIAATNRRLAEDVEEGAFRKDLYFRLSVLEVRLPALRDRREDIPLLADHFLLHFAGNENAPVLSPEAERLLINHAWPGNVRELRNVLERAWTLAGDDGAIEAGAILIGSLASAPRGTAESFADGSLPWSEAHRRFEYAYLQDLLERHGRKVAEAAETMGVRRQSLYRLLKKHGIKP